MRSKNSPNDNFLIKLNYFKYFDINSEFVELVIIGTKCTAK